MTTGLEKKQALLDKGASMEEIGAWEQHTRQRLTAAGASAAEVDNYFGVGPANTAALDRLYPGESLRPAAQEKPQPENGPRRPTSIAEAWTAGQQTSLAGLAARGRAPDIALGDQENLFYAISSAFGTLAGDLPVVLPTYAAAFTAGAKVGGLAGGVVAKGNPIATGTGALAGGLASGGFVSGFVSEQLRSAMLEFYEENEGRNVGKREFAVGVAAKALTQEVLGRAFKEGAINAAGSLAGGPVAGKLAGANPFVRGAAVGSAELAGSVGLASAIEGELPDATEFGAMAAVSVGAGAAGGLFELKRKGGADAETAAQIERRLKKLYKTGGKHPKDIVQEAELDPIAREQLITGEGLTEADTAYTDAQEATSVTPPPPPYDRVAHEAEVRLRYPMERKTTLWADTRGQGEFYHGARGEITKLYEGGGYSALNYYGGGFYTTEAVDIAAGYVRGNKEGVIYSVSEIAPVSAFDMEQPVPDWLLLKEGEMNEILLVAEQNPKNVRELFDMAREELTAEGLTANDIQEVFDAIQTRIMNAGFNALDHKGGLRTNRPEHKVRIYLTPESTIKVEKVDVAQRNFVFDKSEFDRLEAENKKAQEEYALHTKKDEAPSGAFSENARLRIPHEAVDAEYVDAGGTGWTKYTRAARGKRSGDRTPPAAEVALFGGGGGKGALPPKGNSGGLEADGPATRADMNALLGRTAPSEKKRQVRDIDDFRFEVVDDLQYAKSFIAEAHKKATGRNLSPENNPGELMATARGSDAIADQHINRGVFARGQKKKVAPALKEVFGGLNASQQEALGAYFLAKRTLEKEGQGFDTGMDVAAATRIVVSAEKSPEVLRRRALKQQWDFAGIDWVVDSGLVSEKGGDVIRAQNEDYVPFFALGLNDGREQATRGFSVRKPYKEFKGRDISIVDPLEALVKNRFYVIRMAENNRAKVRYAAFNDGLPAAFRVMDRVTPYPFKAKPKGADQQPMMRDLFPELTADEIAPQLRIADASEAKQKEVLEKFEAAQYDPERALVTIDENGNTEIVLLDDLARNTPAVKKFMDANGLIESDIQWLHVAPELDARASRNGNIVLFQNGRPIVYRARDARLAKSFEHLTRGELNFVTKVLSAPARLVRTAITTWPSFIKASLIRDTVDAALINKFDFKPVLSTIDGAVQTLTKSADFEQYVANGGAGAALVDIDADLREISISAFGKSRDPLQKARNLVSSGFSALYGVGATFDQFNRAAAFKQGVSEGLAPEQAALRGRKVSLDFAQAGASMYAWNSIMVFLGPSINGIDRARLAAMSPGHLALTAATYVALPTIVLWAVNAQEEWYQELTSSEKARFWHLRVGGDASPDGAKVMRIEKPHAWVSLFSTTPELVLNHIYKKSNPNLAKNLLEGFQREWLPPAGEITAVQPFFEVAANYDGFLDRAIVSRRLEQTVLPEFRYTPYTSETAKALSKLLPDVVPARFRTPDGIDHLVNAFTGAQGENFLNGTERILAEAGLIEKVKTSRSGFMDSPLVRSVVQEGSRYRGTFDEFYANTERARQTSGTYTELIKQGQLKEAQELQRKYGAYMVKAQQIEMAVGTIFTQIRMVEFSQAIPPDQKKQLVRQYTSFAASMAGAYNQQMRAIEKSQEGQKDDSSSSQ
jgi:hypothetical protein